MRKTIKDFTNYEIDISGEVRNKITGLVKNPTLATNGYYAVTLYKNNKGKTFNIHRLIATYFIENPENLPTVNHRDGIKTNNDIRNLEWSTYGTNNQHAYDTGLKKMTSNMMKHAAELHKSSLENNPYGANRKPVIAISDHGEKEFPSVEMAAKEIGVHRCSIDRVLKGKRKSCKGYVFKYLEVES